MAKISPVSIKYMIYASFYAKGALEKPDVIGAVFGQTEGLLGSDLEMRELQKEGKIGRIEVELEAVDGKTVGEIKIPTAMDKSETSLLAAALETIDRIGPTEAKIEIIKIEDVRGNKRQYIMDRAKKLMESMSDSSFREFSESVKEESRVAKVQEYGESRLPAGNISGNEVIVVEGRADVINLLRNKINNVIGMDGTKLPPEIRELGREKEITLFIDGDRGGKLIAKNVIENAQVKYVAIAPEGKEVEELTGKEILASLRKKISVEEFMFEARRSGIEIRISEAKEAKSEENFNPKQKLRDIYEGVKGSRSALLLDSNFEIIRKISAKEIGKSIKGSKKEIFAVVLEGTATGSLIKLCDEAGISYLAATNFAKTEDAKVNLVSL